MDSTLVKRYRTAYRQADSTISLGRGIRGFGLLLILAAVIGSLILSGESTVLGGTNLFVVLGSGAGVGALLAFVGVIIASQGQILRAALDTAVAGNPLLTQHEQRIALGDG